jgi:exodeoxyribonuclease-3
VRVATWNIINITKRLDPLLEWLDRAKPDVVGLQELKTAAAAMKTFGFKPAKVS